MLHYGDVGITIGPAIQVSLVHESAIGEDFFIAPGNAVFMPILHAALSDPVVAKADEARVELAESRQRIAGIWKAMRAHVDRCAAKLVEDGSRAAVEHGVCVDDAQPFER